MEGQKPDWMVQRDNARKAARPPQANSAAMSLAASAFDFGPDADLSCATIADTEGLELALLANHGLAALLDSGTTSHIMRNRAHFWTYDETLATPVRTANHGVLNTGGRGDCVALIRWSGSSFRLKFRGCLHAPGAVINLVSVGTMVKANFGLNFDFGKVSIMTPPAPSGRRVCYERTLEGKLAFLDIELLMPPPSLHMEPGESSAFARVELTPELWHARLGHAGGEIARRLHSSAAGVTMSPGEAYTCEACIVGKHPRQPHPSSESPRASNFLELVHFDMFGPFPVETPHGKHYGMLFLDDHGNNLKIDLLAAKSQALASFKQMHTHWERKFGRKLLKVRCDNAGEFWSDEFTDYINEQGIERDRACPYSHQQNGKAERAIRTIEGRVLAMLAATGAPQSLWGEATLTAAYLWNRTPSRTLLPGVTPFEMVHGRKPNLSHLRVWGVRCFARVPLELQTKLGLRSRECYFMGYPDGVKGYRVRDVRTRAFFNSRDVIFDENLPQIDAESDGEGWVAPADPNAPSTPAPNVAGPDAVPSTPPRQVTRPSAPPPRPKSTRIRILTESGKQHQAAIQKAKETRERLAAAREAHLAARHEEAMPEAVTGAADAGPTDGMDLRAVDDTGVGGHVFGDEHANLVCSESAFLSIRSDRPRDPAVQSYDMRIPPANYAEARRRSDFSTWDATVQKELATLKDMGVYSLSSLPSGRKAIGNRWVFEHKIDGTDLLAKGRVVVQGFHQIQGVDFCKTFAPVVKGASVRMVAATACRRGWFLECFDATRAFLWGDLEEELYMKVPDGFRFPDKLPPGCTSISDVVMRLWKSLYGLKQASRVWYIKFRGVLEKLGFSCSEADHALFIFNSGWHGELVQCLLAIHVDDGMAGSSSQKFLNWVKEGILKEFGLKDLGPVKTFLGVQFERSLATIELWIHQSEYIDTLLADYDLTDCASVLTPMDSDHPFGRDADSFPSVPNIKASYQALMGRLLFLSLFTRPDITLAVNRLTQFNANPLPCHYAAAKRLIRYLKGTKDLRLHFGGEQGNEKDKRLRAYGGVDDLVGFSDSDWGGEEDRISVSGYAWFYMGCLIDWGCKKQRTVALSSTEAEYMAMALAMQNGLWLRSSLAQAKLLHSPCTPLHVDNQSAIALGSNSSMHGRAKHIDIKYHFIRHHISDNTFRATWIPTASNTADILTKPLARTLHETHRQALGLVLR